VSDAGTASAINHRRTTEEPRVDFVDKKPPDGGDAIVLAAITIDAGGNVAEIDNTARGFAGSVIDPKSEPTVRNLTVTGNQKVGGKLDAGADVELGANLRVAGNAELRGVRANTLEVAAGATIVSGLQVQGVCDLRSNVAVGVDLAVTQKLDVAGSATLRSNVTVNGDTRLLGAVGLGSAGVSALGAVGFPARIVHGVVRSDGTRVGQGFSAARIPGGQGMYDITFDPPFPVFPIPPSSYVTPMTVEPAGKLAPTVDILNAKQFISLSAMVFGIDNERLRVVIVDNRTNATHNAAFSFVVIGLR
jgi:hypothetical protein